MICIDPLLSAFRRAAGVTATSGFVDDWSAACAGATFQEAVCNLEALLEIVRIFEQASGSRINRDKSAVVPSRLLSASEVLACQAVWIDLRVSYRERLLGLFIGLQATLDDQFSGPLQKFDRALESYNSQRQNLSLAARIVVVNVFLWTLFSFP